MSARSRQTRAEAVVEDCEWMARWGESLTGAARRLGYRDRKVLDRTLQRAGRYDLIAALKAVETDDLRAGHNADRRGRRSHGLAA
ncbi:hypothetical protein [Cellulomonas sp.]|uniref:hypothetical protein n=1 Tax=Cellulomonas sp. TaxID=40001 RepID=UPI001B24F440|nr:hypothetical protein [Cellulomonas sp.]MBO9556738.1 hypothetical protein [Cellulomonas sp.]